VQLRSLAIPFSYIAEGNLTHGYAMTIHKAQGATADRAFLLADDTMAREHLYTAMSRGVTRNDLYLVVDDQRADIRHAPEVVKGPDEAVRSAVRRSAAKSMAVDDVALDDPYLRPTNRPEVPTLERQNDGTPSPDMGIDIGL
jgi:hypothetical protein